jgi:hypothetical protein
MGLASTKDKKRMQVDRKSKRQEEMEVKVEVLVKFRRGHL